jgi:hypothetical protein
MIIDLQHHELVVLKAFFARAIAWVETESASESAKHSRLENADSETVESVIFNPHGAHEFEQIVLRTTINELNSLCEFALQHTWTKLSGNRLTLPNGELIFTATRGDIEKALRSKEALGDKTTEVEDWPRWHEIKEIKELSEGFKHRQRLQPFPGEFHSQKNQWRSNRLVEPNNENVIAEYELTTADVAKYIDAVEELFSWLSSNRML